MRAQRQPGSDDTPREPPAVKAPGRARGRARRLLRRALLALLALLLAAGPAALVALKSLDRPWVKGHLLALVKRATAAELGYRTCDLSIGSGLVVSDLTVATPAPFRAFAPEVLRVGRLEVRWSSSSLVHHGTAPALEQVTASDVAITVVVNERGETSLDTFSSATPDTEPKVPLSHQAGDALATPPPLAALTLTHVAVTLVTTRGARVAEEDSAHGLALAMTVARKGSLPSHAASGFRLHVEVGAEGAPLDLAVARATEGGPPLRGQGTLALLADVDATAASVKADFKVLTQSFAPTLAGGGPVDALHADLRATFDRAAGRTTVTVSKATLAGGAATFEASLEIPDRGAAIVRHAEAAVDLARLLPWAPPGLVPLEAARARLNVRADAVSLGPVFRLDEEGTVDVEATLGEVRVHTGGALPTQQQHLALDTAALTLHATRAEGASMVVTGGLTVGHAEFISEGLRGLVHGLTVDFAGAEASDGALRGGATARFANLASSGRANARARDGSLSLGVDALYLGAQPLAARGAVTFTASFGALDAHEGATRVLADGAAFEVRSVLLGQAPYGANLALSARRLRAFGAGGRLLVDGSADAEVSVHDVSDLQGTRAQLEAKLSLGALQATLEATRDEGSLDYALAAEAKSLGLLRPFVGDGDARAPAAPWDSMGFTLRSHGHAEHLGTRAPELRETTALRLDRPEYAGAKAASASLDLESSGGLLKHQVKADLRLSALAVHGTAPSDDHLTLTASLDRTRPWCAMKVTASGRAAASLSAEASFDHARHAVLFDIDGRLSGLGPLGPLVAEMPALGGLAGFDLAKLKVGLTARGALFGAVAEVAATSAVTLAPSPARTAAVEGVVDLRGDDLRWAHGDTLLETPHALFHADLKAPAADERAPVERTVESHVDVGALHLGLGQHVVEVAGVTDHAHLTVRGSLLNPETELTLHAAIDSVAQDFAPAYPVGHLTSALVVSRDPEGLVHVSSASVDNRDGGTALSLTGGADLGPGRRRLSMTADLAQDLAKLSEKADARGASAFSGRGKIQLAATVESPDLTTYRTRADLKAEGVSLRMPRLGVTLDDASGEVPVTAIFELGKDGLTMRHDARVNPYSMLRFADQHPLIRRSGFISVARLMTPYVTLAPLAGNLEIVENVISLRQFEMGVRGGHITGESALVWSGAGGENSTLELHVRANGVQSSHGEPFDGNIAVVMAAGERTIEGRAEVLRIGKRHLQDLIDLEDPTRMDPAMNRIRGALAFGYPDRLRLVFDHGFASAKLELGGLASLVSIDEIKGIPMGPIMDKLVSQSLDGSQ